MIQLVNLGIVDYENRNQMMMDYMSKVTIASENFSCKPINIFFSMFVGSMNLNH